MRKLLRLAKREYLASVKTKGFIIMLVLMPVLMGGSGIAMLLLQDQVDTTDKKVAVLDRSGVIADVLLTAAKERNDSAVFDKESLNKEGDMAHLKIEIVDEDGNVVTTATNVITVDLNGAGELMGVESGEIVDGEVDLQSNSRMAYFGKLLAFIQPVQKKGNISITISSPGLESKTVQINSK